ncbi:LysM peptidoglycan-binding domain-containing protein [bacterium]|nr:LysM peptidoglycan-binding domain-containing protein [bacterium]
MVEKISGVSSYAMQPANKPQTEEDLIVEARKNGRYRVGAKETLSTIAKRFGVDNYKTLMKLIGRSESKTSLSKGEELTGFKTVKCKQGQGLSALARAAGMSLNDFCTLNNIDKNYVPKEGEQFFRAFTAEEIKKANPSASTSGASSTSTTTAVASDEASDRAKGQYTVKKGETLYAIADSFNMNVNDFLKRTGLKSSSINEGQVIKNVPTLTVQAGKGWSWILANSNGMTKTEIMELNGLPKNYEPKANEKLYIFGTKAAASEAEAAAGGARVKDSKTGTYKVPECGYVTAKPGEKVATGGKKPLIPIGPNGAVQAEVIKFNPTNKNGDLKGKTIMVNAGHGWGAKKSFAPGTSAMDSKGKVIYEWYKNRNFADELIRELTSRGATVIYTGGSAGLAGAAKAKFKPHMLISLHCNAAGSSKPEGLEIFYYDQADKNLADKVDKRFEKFDNCAVKPDTQSQHSGLGILRNTASIPSILLEMGYQSNPDDLKNIDSLNFRQDTMKAVADAIEEYFGV